MSAAYTFLEMAHDALEKAERPVDRSELWELCVALGLSKKVQTGGKTPWETIGARVYVDTSDNPASRIIRVGKRPIRFWLRERPLPKGWSEAGPKDGAESKPLPAIPKPEGKATKKPSFTERQIHPVLAYFAYSKLSQVYVKTIHHEKSSKTTFGEWVHPDLIGVWFPMKEFDQATVEFSGAAQASLLRIYSFEMKRKVDFGNLRECFFQAVSNSSWAHQGYLVAADWNDDPEFFEELQRLCGAFGIGAIHIDVQDPSASRIMIPSKLRDDLDWSTLDKLVGMNEDVKSFLENVRIDVQAKRVHESEYDTVPLDPVDLARALTNGSA